ncbi:MAG: carbohydrate kinase [Deinococcota bacterium]
MTSPTIVCFGEALIDFKATGPLGFQGYCGGSPFNVATSAARLDAEVGFGAQISCDQFGDALVAYLQENKVDTSLVLRSDAPSTLAFVGEVNGEAVFDFMAVNAADTLYDPQPRPELAASTQFVALGSISLLQEPTASSITEICYIHRERACIFFDPNVRPALIKSRAAYLLQLQGLVGLSHITKVSTQDLEWLYPDEDPAEVALRWLHYGANAVLVTRGEGGVSLFRAGKDTLNVRAPKVDVIDTVGAGDTLSGALMVSLLPHVHAGADVLSLADDPWQTALITAVNAAAFNCTRSGAQPPNKEELEAFMNASSSS